MNVVFSPAGSKVRGWQSGEDFSLSLVSDNESFGTSSNITPTAKDLTYAARTTTGTIIKSQVNVTTPPDAPVTFTTDTPAVCTVAADGKVSLVANGTCTINVRSRTGSRKSSQDISASGGSTVYDAVTGRAAGSLRAYLDDQQRAALVGVVPGSGAQRAHATPYNAGFSPSGSGVNTGNFIRAQSRPGFGALPLDALDELLVGAAGSAQWRAWISPRHFLTWRGHNSVSSAGNWVSIGGEIVVEYSTTPWAGTLCKLLPSNWRSYMPDSLSDRLTAIALWTRHYNTYDAGEDKRWVMPSGLGVPESSVYATTDTRRAFQKVYNNELLSTDGDSGSPAFVGINGALVPLGHTAYYGSVCSWWFGDYRTQIDAAMATLNASGLYTAQTVNLSGFTSYP
jgi:hypothetical protein